jgi:hypothetical protein
VDLDPEVRRKDIRYRMAIILTENFDEWATLLPSAIAHLLSVFVLHSDRISVFGCTLANFCGIKA